MEFEFLRMSWGVELMEVKDEEQDTVHVGSQKSSCMFYDLG